MISYCWADYNSNIVSLVEDNTLELSLEPARQSHDLERVKVLFPAKSSSKYWKDLRQCHWVSA